jgi:hypothetical protein
MKKTQTVVLEIQFDDEMCESPADWNWRELLDLGPDEEVKVLLDSTRSDS